MVSFAGEYGRFAASNSRFHIACWSLKTAVRNALPPLPCGELGCVDEVACGTGGRRAMSVPSMAGSCALSPVDAVEVGAGVDWLPALPSEDPHPLSGAATQR